MRQRPNKKYNNDNLVRKVQKIIGNKSFMAAGISIELYLVLCEEICQETSIYRTYSRFSTPPTKMWRWLRVVMDVVRCRLAWSSCFMSLVISFTWNQVHINQSRQWEQILARSILQEASSLPSLLAAPYFGFVTADLVEGLAGFGYDCG